MCNLFLWNQDTISVEQSWKAKTKVHSCFHSTDLYPKLLINYTLFFLIQTWNTGQAFDSPRCLLGINDSWDSSGWPTCAHWALSTLHRQTSTFPTELTVWTAITREKKKKKKNCQDTSNLTSSNDDSLGMHCYEVMNFNVNILTLDSGGKFCTIWGY